MRFLCLECDAAMAFAERRLPGDGTLVVVFTCPRCGKETALLTNPMETRLVSGLGIEIGGRTVPAQPMELVRSSLATGGEAAFADAGPAGAVGAPEANADGSLAPPAEAPRVTPGTIRWSEEARARLANVPAFVRGMVKRIYGEYAVQRGIAEITPEVMDRARAELGLEGM